MEEGLIGDIRKSEAEIDKIKIFESQEIHWGLLKIQRNNVRTKPYKVSSLFLIQKITVDMRKIKRKFVKTCLQYILLTIIYVN